MKTNFNKGISKKEVKLNINANFPSTIINELFDLYKNKEGMTDEMLMSVKKDMEFVMNTCEFYYQSPQAEEAQKNGEISFIDAEYLSPVVFGSLLNKTQLEDRDIVKIFDSYNGKFGVHIKNDHTLKVDIFNFSVDCITEKGYYNQDEFLELYDKSGNWIEAHIVLDEDSNSYKLQIDIIPSEQKISTTRDFDCLETELPQDNPKNNVLAMNIVKEELYKYLDIDYSEFLASYNMDQFKDWIARNDKDGIDFLLNYVSSENVADEHLEYIVNTPNLCYDSVLCEIIGNSKTPLNILKKIELPNDSDNKEALKLRLQGK